MLREVHDRMPVILHPPVGCVAPDAQLLESGRSTSSHRDCPVDRLFLINKVVPFTSQLGVPVDAFLAGIGDYKIVTTLCPGGKERMRRLMELVALHRIDLTPLLTHTFNLDDIVEAYRFFEAREDGVIKVAIKTDQER